MCPSPNLHLKELEKNEYPKLSANRRKEMMKIRAEIKQRTERQSRINKVFIYLFLRETAWAGEGQRGRDRIPRRLCVARIEPKVGAQTLETVKS